MKQLYACQTKDINRYKDIYELSRDQISDTISYYDEINADSNQKLKPNDFNPSNTIIIEKIGQQYVEWFSNRVIVDLETSEYINGIIIDQLNFIKNLIPIQEKEIDRMFCDFNDECLNLRFQKFVMAAQKAYLNILIAENNKQLEKTEKRGKKIMRQKLKRDSLR